MPAVSFIIPSYNYASHITEALNSVFAIQQDGDEIIVVDDGSTDNTKQVLQPLIDQQKIIYYYQENAGVSAARNYGAQLAKKDVLYFLDADDRVVAEGFNRLRLVAMTQLDKALVIGGHSSVEGKRHRVHPQKSLSDDHSKNFIDYVIHRRFSIANGGTALIRRDVALKYPYPEDLKVSEDFCVYAWILANEAVSTIPDIIVEIKKHDDSLRNETADYADIVERLPAILFDSIHMPKELRRYKQLFYCNRLLSLFRVYYHAGDNVRARETYQKAVRCKPLNLFKLSYLRKFIRLLLT